MKVYKIILSLLLCLSFLLTFGCTPKENVAEGLKVHYIDVGQGDSAFIEFPDGETMLIDAGEREYGETVVDYIKKLGHKTIDYVVGTHPHSDHIGGLEEIIRNFTVDKVYMPKVSSNTKTFEDLLIAVKEKGLSVTSAKKGVKIIDKENLTVEVLAPVNNEYADINNYSTVIMLTFLNNKFLFTGDAETLVESELSGDLSCDVLKIGHHGSSTSTSPEFLKATMPEYAVISCGKDNKYGHPHKEVLDRLNDFEVQVIRTDINGTVIIESDGDTLSFPETSIVQQPVLSYSSQSGSETTRYVLNISSKKIHLPECGSVLKMKAENSQEFFGDLEELIDAGYTPCGACKPE